MLPIFSTVGRVVSGESFHGRVEDIRFIENRCVSASAAGNIAIVGLPKIGKSSLVWKCFMEDRERLFDRNILPVWINMATFSSVEFFFSGIISKTIEEFEEVEESGIDLSRLAEYESAIKNAGDSDFLKRQVYRFFKYIRKDKSPKRSWKVILILDEFDAARNLFKEKVSWFQFLRELSYTPEYGVCLVTTSRRTVAEIESNAGEISNLAQIFNEMFLRGYSEDDFNELIRKVEGFVSLGELKCDGDFFRKYCGNHPYLLANFLSCVDEYSNADELLEMSKNSFYDYFSSIEDLLKSQDLYQSLLAHVIGPLGNSNMIKTEKLCKYGILTGSQNSGYNLFSDYYSNYINFSVRRNPFEDSWTKTEISLRKYLEKRLIEKHGEEWILKLPLSCVKTKPFIDSALEKRERERRQFGDFGAVSVLDYMYPMELYEIMCSDWSFYGSFLGGDKKYWRIKFEILNSVRNPFAHNRVGVVPSSKLMEAEGICMDLNTKISDAGFCGFA